MRLQDEGEHGFVTPYAPGGIIVGPLGSSDTILAHIGRHEQIYTAEDVRGLRDPGLPEWFTRSISESMPGVQDEMTLPFNTGYDNVSDVNRKYRWNVALDRDNRLNKEERAEYDRTLVELEYGPGFFRRAHP